MRNKTYSNVRFLDLQSKPFHEGLPLIIHMDDAVFLAIIDFLAGRDNHRS